MTDLHHDGTAPAVNGEVHVVLRALSEPLLTADEVAALLRVPRSTVYELTRTRRLPHVKLGRRTLFVRVDLDAWVMANRERPRR
jgi:excisionase family DNA binding protein